MENLLCKEFSRDMQKGQGLGAFFKLLREMDKHILFIPFNKAELYTAAMPEDEADFFDPDEYALTLVKRATDKRVLKKIAIDTLLDVGGDDISPFIDELMLDRDSVLVFGGTQMCFAMDHSLRELAKLSRLSGEALKKQSVYRDNYIAHLVNERCAEYASKRVPKPAFTAIAFEQFDGIKRVMAVRSGNYHSIPQATLEDAFDAMMEKDDWGVIECRNWHIDHEISYVDLEFPDIADEIMSVYPEAIKSFMVPGIRLSTGSTGLNSLKATMTWRIEDHDYPALLTGVTQKHCNTYEKEEFLTAVHQQIWDKYGELPERLAKLYTVSISSESEYISSCVSKVYKQMSLNKVFMQGDEGSKTGKADYHKRLADYVTGSLCYKLNPTAYDLATKLMGAADVIDIPESYRDTLRNALAKAPYCDLFTQMIEEA